MQTHAHLAGAVRPILTGADLYGLWPNAGRHAGRGLARNAVGWIDASFESDRSLLRAYR
jgi:hypothetical protein